LRAGPSYSYFLFERINLWHKKVLQAYLLGF
jgi:hypothetical protein